MLDCKNLNDSTMRGLSELPYDKQVEIFDDNCANCPHKFLVTKNSQGRIVKEHTSLVTGINYTLFRTHHTLVRGCNFNDEYHSLKEIITNTCRFWKKQYDESYIEGSATEVEEITVEIADIREIHS